MTDPQDYQTESAVAADLALQLKQQEPFMVETGRRDYADLATWVLHNQGSSFLHQLDLDPYADRPHRATGHAMLSDHESFSTYVLRFLTNSATTVWGNPKRGTVTAILNDHGDDGLPGWGDHQATLQLQQTDDWKHWTAQDGRMMPQSAFAEHLEEGADCVVEPSAADMLEIAQHFTAKNNVSFRSARRIDNGEVQLQYEENIQAKAGQKGTMTIPVVFTLGIAPFEGGSAYKMLARFRYRLVDGHLTLGYKLVRPDQIVLSAFGDITKEITSKLDLPMLLGDARR